MAILLQKVRAVKRHMVVSIENNSSDPMNKSFTYWRNEVIRSNKIRRTIKCPKFICHPSCNRYKKTMREKSSDVKGQKLQTKDSKGRVRLRSCWHLELSEAMGGHVYRYYSCHPAGQKP